MSSFLCFVCHSTVNADTNEDIREKYRDIIGMNLCQESHLCFICCHFLNKMWLFKSICLKRTLEYPVLFSEKGAINLHKSDTQVSILCPEDICIQHLNTKIHYYNTNENSQSDIENDSNYVQLHDEKNYIICENRNICETRFDIQESLLKNDCSLKHEQAEDMYNKDIFYHDDCTVFVQKDTNFDQNFNNYDDLKLMDVSERCDRNLIGGDRNLMNIDRDLITADRNLINNSNLIGHDRNLVANDRSLINNDGNMVGHDRNLIVNDRNCMNNDRQLVPNQNLMVSNTNLIANDRNLIINDTNIDKNVIVDDRNLIINVPNANSRSSDKMPINNDTNLIINDNKLIINNRNNINNSYCNVIVTNITEISSQSRRIINDNMFLEKNDHLFTHREKVYDNTSYNNIELEITKLNQNNDKIEYNNDNAKNKIDDNEDFLNKNYMTFANNDKIDENDMNNSNDTEISRDNEFSNDTNSQTDNSVNSLDDNDYYEFNDKNYHNSSPNGNQNKNSYINEYQNNGINDTPKATNDNACQNDNQLNLKKNKKKSKKKDFIKKVLSVEEQKSEIERSRKEKKYIEAVFKCHSCAIGFLFKYSYQAHMMRHEESNGEYLCPICLLRFASIAVLRSHRLNHSERYSCTLCEATVSRRQRQTHIRSCRSDREDDIVCHLCENVFRGSNNFQQHLKRFHQSKTSNRTYSCNVCGKMYHNQAAVRTHMITHINKKFSCEECNAIFSSPYTLNQHKKKHTSETMLHYCDICKLSYNSRKSLLAHMRNTLAHKQSVYKCPICDRTCPSLRSLQSHTLAVHERSKHLACDICPARYSTRKALLRHLLTHKNEMAKKTPLCHACGESFKSTSILKRHLKNVCEKEKVDDESCNYY